MRANILGFVTVGVLSWSNAAWADAAADCVRFLTVEDYKKAFVSCTEAAEQSNSNAQYNLGVMYMNGIGVVQDYAEAVRWYKLAAEQGDSAAQYNLGLLYADGTGVVQDYAEATRWYKLAAEQGDADAQTALGVAYANGTGVVQDYVTAHMWYNLSAAETGGKATENRDLIAKTMTPAQIAEAQQRAQACIVSNFINC